MKATVLIPSYRRGPALLDCLQGVINCTRPPDEIIIVLRDTDSESHDLVNDWLTGCPHAQLFKVVDVTPRGQIAAMNRGLEVASGDVIVFTDDDAIPRPDWLDRILRHYDAQEVGGAGGRDVVHHGQNTVVCHAKTAGILTWYGKVIGNHHCQIPGKARPVDHIKGVNMSFRREHIMPFDPGIWGPHFNDTDQALAVSTRGFRLIFDPEAVVDHYPTVRPDNPSGRDMSDPRQIFLDAHDHCYLLMKYRPGILTALWLPYLILIGDRNCPGLARFIFEAITFRRDAWRRFVSAISGTRAALTRMSRPDNI